MPQEAGHVLIVGTSYCGSTFLSRVLMLAGCDFGQGDPPARWTVGAHSMEHPAIVRPSYALYRVLEHQTLLMPVQDRADEAVSQCRQVIDEAFAVWPPFVKSPAMGYVLDVWLRAGLRPSGVIVCTRGLEETMQSLIRRRQSYGVSWSRRWEDTVADRQRLQTFFGLMMSNVLAARVPWAVVRFPWSIQDESAGPIYDDLQAKIGLPCSRQTFLVAHDRAADPELVHVRKGKPWEPLPRRS